MTVIEVTERIWKEDNPNSRMKEPPSALYETIEAINRKAREGLDLYTFCRMEFAKRHEQKRILGVIEDAIEESPMVNHEEDNYDAGRVHALLELTQKIKGE